MKSTTNGILGVLSRFARFLRQKGNNILFRYIDPLKPITKGSTVKSYNGRIGKVITVYRKVETNKIVGYAVKWYDNSASVFVSPKEIFKI